MEKIQLQQDQATELEKASDKGYNEAIIVATRELKNLKYVIYQADFDHGLEKA